MNPSHRDIKEVDVLKTSEKTIVFHPLEIKHSYDEDRNEVTVRITQDVETHK